MIELITSKEGFVIQEVIDFMISGLEHKFGPVRSFESDDEYKVEISTQEDYIEVFYSIQTFVELFGNKMLTEEFNYSLYEDAEYKLTVYPNVGEPEFINFLQENGYDTENVDLDEFLNVLRENYGEHEDQSECTFPDCDCFS